VRTDRWGHLWTSLRSADGRSSAQLGPQGGLITSNLTTYASNHTSPQTPHLVGNRAARSHYNGATLDIGGQQGDTVVGARVTMPPDQPGEVLRIANPIQIEPGSGVGTLTNHGHFRMLSSTPSQWTVTLNEIPALGDRPGWRDVPGLTLVLRQISGPHNGVTISKGSAHLAGGPVYDLGSTHELVSPINLTFEYLLPGDYIFIVELSGSNIHGDTVAARWKECIYSLKMNSLYETVNISNRIFNPTNKDDPYLKTHTPDAEGYVGVPRNILYTMSNPDSDMFEVSIDVDIQPEPARKYFICAAMSNWTSMIPGSHTPVPPEANTPVEMKFRTPPHIVTCTVYIGLDNNYNLMLDPNEGEPLVVSECPGPDRKYAQIVGSGNEAYALSKNEINSIIDGRWDLRWRWTTELFISHAKRFLQIFRDGSDFQVPADRKPSHVLPATINAFEGDFSDWLTHNSGAPFDEHGLAGISEYIWESDTSTAALVANSSQIRNKEMEFYRDQLVPQVTAYFASLPVGSEFLFPSANDWYTLSADETVHFDTLDWWPNILDDLNGTIGRGLVMSHKARYSVKKIPLLNDHGPTTETVLMLTIYSKGVVLDLYDFNFETGGAGQDAAIVQIGFSNGWQCAAVEPLRTSGAIFRHRIEFELTRGGILP
jgi:hypothetical protein